MVLRANNMHDFFLVPPNYRSLDQNGVLHKEPDIIVAIKVRLARRRKTVGGGMVDSNAFKTNQALIVALVGIGFVLGAGNGGPWLVALVAVSLGIGAAWPGNGPFQLFYRRVLVPLGVIEPKRVADQPEPHRFAQAMGAVCLALSALLLLAGASAAGWALAAIVVALALVNLLFSFCAGCFIFLHVQRLRRRSGVAS